MSSRQNPRRSRAEVLEEGRTKRIGHVAEQIGRAVAITIRVGGVVTGVYFITEAWIATAGTETSFVLQWIGSLSAPDWFGILFGFGGVSYGLMERRERQSKTRTLAKRIQDLEIWIDPNRDSSGLAPDGRTRPGEE